MIFNSIRWQVQIWHGLILVTVLLGFGFAAYHVAQDNQMRAVDQELSRQMMSLLRPGRGPEAGPPRDPERFGPMEFPERLRGLEERGDLPEFNRANGSYFVVWLQDGTVAAHSPFAPAGIPMPEFNWPAHPRHSSEGPAFGHGPPQGPTGPPGPPVARTRGGFREVAGAAPGGFGILVGCSLDSERAAVRRLAVWLATAGAAILVLGLAGGWWLATRAIQPIEAISQTAGKIAEGDLSQRIDVADTESELGRLAGVLNSTFARLDAAFARQAQFTSDASHELRTPVSVLLTQTQTALSRERPAAEYREALEACQRAAQRMRKLVESLLDLARLDGARCPLKQDTVDLAALAAECIEFVKPLAAPRAIRIVGELQPVTCPGDAERLAQVLTNLLTNAIQFNRNEGEIRVITARRDNAACVTVEDTGGGIPPEDLPHVFERFYRADKSRSGTGGNAGLGLAICKMVIEAHRGAIEASSQLNHGTTFTFRLPLH